MARLAVKGVKFREIVRLPASGERYDDIRRRYPRLSPSDIDLAVRWRNATLLPARPAEGRSLDEIGREFVLGRSGVWAALERDWLGKIEGGGWVTPADALRMRRFVTRLSLPRWVRQ